ncbi:MAG TPA: CinA family nicotinamide mononucleotide deamidase-related protein [Pirellulaceae bacterium]|nr:CinA family nicotinamide mononucleotide deamidase-related protein [Pirellulaceae bacterium]
MRAEIIAIGDEMTTGQRLDTNSQWLAERLLEIGVPVAFHTTVGDQLADNVLVFRQACERADIVVASGGLGPTADDLTRQALADLAGVPLVQDDAMLEHIKALFARRKRAMPPANVVQALFPQGSRPIPNPHGSAPGIDIEIPRAGGKSARVFAVPGVPAEMKEMWAASVGPAIRERLGIRKVIAHHRLKCFGVGESDLEAMLPDLIARQRYPLVGITVSQATITLRITAEGETAEAARAAMQPTIETIEQCLGDLIFGEEDEELEHAVIRRLLDRRETLAVVEWGTGGVLANWLSECPGSSGVFEGGLVVRNHVALESMLPVRPEAWRNEGFRSASFTGELARAALERFGTDWVLVVGPFPEDERDIAVFLGMATKDGVITKPITFAGHPSILKDRTAKQALDWLRKRATPPT